MADGVQTTRKKRRGKVLFGTLGIVLALALSFCGWVYKAKTQRDLNMQLLGAVRKGDAEAARSLLKRGADPNIRDVPQRSLSLWQQIRYAFHKDSQPADDQPQTVLEMAMMSDPDYASDGVRRILVKSLLEAGARPDDCSERHITPLMRAVKDDSPQIVQMLLNLGANPLAKDDEGRRPIDYMYFDDPDGLKIAEMLVKRGSDVNAVDNNGRTLLLQSCYYKNIHMLRFLIAHGARVDVCDKHDNTPLIYCLLIGLFSKRKDTDMAKFLIAHGADVNHRNILGGTALSIAKRHKDKEMVRLLEAAGARR